MDNLPDISVQLQNLVELSQVHGETLQDPEKGSASPEQVLEEMLRILQDMKTVSDDIEARRFDLYRSGVEKGVHATIALYTVIVLLVSFLNRTRMNRWLYRASMAAILLVFVLASINAPDWIVSLMKEDFDLFGSIFGRNG